MLEQATYLPNGIIQSLYNLNKENLVVVSEYLKCHILIWSSDNIIPILLNKSLHPSGFRHGFIKLQTLQELKSFVEYQGTSEVMNPRVPSNQLAQRNRSRLYLKV